MSAPNPTAHVQISLMDSDSDDDDDQRENNIDHDDDDCDLHEETTIGDLLESIYVHDDGDEIDGGERDGDSERDNMYSASKIVLYEGTTTTILSATLLLMNVKTKFGWSDTSFSALLRYIVIFFPILRYRK